MDLYDPQTLGVMVFGGFMVISAIGIFLVSTFSMKETSYEEALAKQRKVLEKAQQPKVDKKKKEKPIEKKGKAKKREDKPNGKIPEQDSAQDMNDSSKELDSEPEIIAEFVIPEPSAVIVSTPPPPPPPSVQEKPAPSPKDKKRKEKKVSKAETVPVGVVSAQAVASKPPPVTEVITKEAPVVAVPPVSAHSSIPVAARLPAKKAEVAAVPGKKAEVAAVPGKKAEVAAVPGKKAEVAAVPGKKAEVAAVPGKKAEVASVPGKKAEVASVPGKKAEVASVPGKKAEVVSMPTKKPEVASVPTKKPEVASVPTKKPEVASVPGKKPEVASVPGKKPEVASVPGKKPEVASVPGKKPEVASVPGKKPEVASMPGKKPEVASVPVKKVEVASLATKKVEVTSLPVKKVEAVPAAVKKAEVASLSAKKVDSVQSQEEPKPEVAIKKKSAPKKKADPTHTDTDGPLYLPYGTLLSTVGSMTFSEGEAQRLIEILTEKTGIVQDTWHTATQKGDLVSTLKRQLEEKEKLLSAEQEDTVAAKNKLRDLSKELAAEKVKAVGVETKLKEQLLTRDQEINAVQARMQATYQDHVGETQQLQGKIRSLQEQLENGPNTQLTRLQQENSILRDALNQATSQMESKQNAELAKLRQECSKLTKEVIEKSEVLQQEEQLRKSLDVKVVAFEKQINQLQVSQKETEDILQKRLEEVSEELRRSQSSYKSLQTETEKSKGEQKIVSDLQTKLLSSEEQSKSKSQDLDDYKEKLLAVNDENKQLTERIRAIEALLEAGQSSEAEQEKELQAAKQAEITRLQARLQERDAKILSLENEALQLKSNLEQHTLQNNLANPAEILDLQTRLKERDDQIASLQKEALQLISTVELQTAPSNATEQIEVLELQTRLQQRVDLISSLEKEVAELKETVAQQRIKHNATEQAEVQLQSRLQEKDNLISRLEQEATKLKETVEQQRIPNNEAGQEVIQLQTRLQEKDNLISSLEKEAVELKASMEQQRIKNNDLREKNWQAMEALGLAEKTCTEKVASCKKAQEETEKQLHTLQKQTKETLLSLFPQITVLSDEVYSEWLQEFKEKSTEILSQQTAKTDYPDLSPQLREAEEAHSTLQAECDQYRTILAETEGMLRNLQRSVEQEELVWKAKLAKAEEDLNEAQGQIRSSEDTVEKLKLDLQNSDQLKECISLMETQLDAQMFSANSACQNYSEEVESLQQLLQESQEQLESAKNEARKQSKELSLVRQHLSEMKIHVHDGEAVVSKADQTGQEPDQLKSQLEQTEATLNEEQTLRQKLAEEFEEAAESAFSVRTELAKLRFEGDFTADAEEVAQLKERLEKEKKLTRDLGQAAIKLQELLRATQEQLAKERENVKKLEGLRQETVDNEEPKNGTSV